MTREKQKREEGKELRIVTFLLSSLFTLHFSLVFRRMKMKRVGKLIGLAVVALVVLSTVFAGCSSVHFRAKSSLPIKEQCLLKFTPSARVLKFNDKNVWWFGTSKISVLIPAGTNTLSVYVKLPIKSENYGSYTTITYLTGTFDVEYEFEPGGTYSIEPHYNKQNQIWITIEEGSKGKVKPRLVISAPEARWGGIGLGRDYALNFGMNPSLVQQYGGIIETDILSTGLFFDMSLVTMGIMPGDKSLTDSIGFSSYMGMSSEFYLPGQFWGVGAGGGVYASNFGIGPVAPYVRAIVIPYKGLGKLVTYFDYYLPDIKSSSTFGEDALFSSWGDGTTNKWGLGLIYYLY
jgi:hypothetical protein